MDDLRRILGDQREGPGGEAAPEQLQQLAQSLPPEALARAQEEALQQLSPEERQGLLDQFRAAHDDPQQAFHFAGFDRGDASASPQQLGNMMAVAQRDQPDLLGSILGGDGNNPVMQGLIAAVGGMLLQQMMGGKASASTGQLGGGPLGGILGQVLGGGRQPAGEDSGAAAGGGTGGGMGDILGQVLGGQGGGGLGSILGQLGGGGLGDILGKAGGGQGGAGDATDNPLDLPADSGIEVEQRSEDAGGQGRGHRRCPRCPAPPLLAGGVAGN